MGQVLHGCATTNRAKSLAGCPARPYPVPVIGQGLGSPSSMRSSSRRRTCSPGAAARRPSRNSSRSSQRRRRRRQIVDDAPDLEPERDLVHLHPAAGADTLTEKLRCGPDGALLLLDDHAEAAASRRRRVDQLNGAENVPVEICGRPEN